MRYPKVSIIWLMMGVSETAEAGATAGGGGACMKFVPWARSRPFEKKRYRRDLKRAGEGIEKIFSNHTDATSTYIV
jgi:hypothetical protein